MHCNEKIQGEVCDRLFVMSWLGSEGMRGQAVYCTVKT